MGGLAFAKVITRNGQPPYIPRLLPVLYHTISAEYRAKLEKLFDRVVVPREAPGKVDHGDIDFLVEGNQHRCSRGDIWLAIKEILGAELQVSRGGAHSYAVRHPEISEAYVQIDVEIVSGNGTPEGTELFDWTRFMKGDSDLVQIIGISHRPLGLTCNDHGLHLSIEEMEPYNKKKALLFLTRDPNTAMEFYGFDVAKYWAGFADENELFGWVSGGRFFSREIFDNRAEKANDRARQRKRPMYQRFVEEYMPAHPQPGDPKIWTRAGVLQEALSYFNKHANYEAMMDEHRQKEAEEKLWSKIREMLPVEGNSLGLTLKGLRRWVVFEDCEPRIASLPMQEYQRWIKSVTTDNEATVLHWVSEHWEEVKALEKARGHASREAATTS